MDKFMAFLASEYFLDFWIPVLFLIYGLITYFKPAKYKAKGGVGFATKRALKNERVWYYVQRVAGLLCMILAVVLALTAWFTYTVIGGLTGYLIQIALSVAALAGLIPVVNWLTDRKFDWNR